FSRDSKQQSLGWAELWEIDHKPSPALIEFIKSKPEVLSNITNKYRPKALVPGCRKGYDVIALALYGFDVYRLEVSETGLSSDIGNVAIIAGDFLQKGWESQGVQRFDVIYDYIGLKGVYWNLLVMGGNGIIDQPGKEEISKEGLFRRLLYFKPPRSYKNGRGTDMVSVWSASPWQFPNDTHK
ncbi:hypothetical protein FCULG_00011823, partial [Fusarium culmorum]